MRANGRLRSPLRRTWRGIVALVRRDNRKSAQLAQLTDGELALRWLYQQYLSSRGVPSPKLERDLAATRREVAYRTYLLDQHGPDCVCEECFDPDDAGGPPTDIRL